MLRIVSFFAIIIALCLSLAQEVVAQSAGMPPPDVGSTAASSSDMSGGAASQGAPVSTAPGAGEALPASSASSSPVATPRSVVSSTSTPRALPVQAVTPIVPRPGAAPSSQVISPPATPVNTPPSAEPLLAATPPQTPNTNNFLPLAVGGVAALTLLGLFFAARVKSKKGKKSDPCGALKKQFEVSKTAYDTITGKITLQELLEAQLKKEIEDIGDRVKGKAKEYAQGVVNEIKDDILEEEKSGTLKEVVGLTEEAKAAYDDLLEKYKQAKELLEILKNRQKGLSDEVREREAAYNVCTQSTQLAGSRVGKGEWIMPLDESFEGKTILVDAVYAFVTDEGKIVEAMHKLLEQYPNRKILLTGANDEQAEKWKLRNMPYEVFTLKHSPEKTDPLYYKKMLEHFGLNKNDVIYFEHNADAVKSAQSVGIKTYYYDNNKSDLEELKKFLDENL